VDIATTAEEALAGNIEQCEAAVVDVMLPNNPELTGITFEESRGGFSTGVCVARRLLNKRPQLKVVLMTSDIVDARVEAWAHANDVAFFRKGDGSATLIRTLDRLGITGGERSPVSLIVHGHEEVALYQLKNYIQNTLHWCEPITLRERPNLGKTIIEKFEDIGRNLDCVFVLLTPDDRVYAGAADDIKRRSRQNVIFELGFFYGVLGRSSGRVLLLHHGPVELPSDIAGIVWIDITAGIESAGEQIRNEVGSLFAPELSWPVRSNERGRA
jgi:Predicted nucleotide-binding protein containing TIR-like domain